MMNTDTGHIAGMEQLKKMFPELKDKNAVIINTSNLAAKFKEELSRIGMTRIGLRSRCPCGSGKRFKSCCFTGSSNAPRQPRRDSGVGLDAVVGGSDTEGTR